MPPYIPYMKNVLDLNNLQPDLSIELGDLGCGDLVMEIMKAVRSMAVGQTLQIHATDPAASIDIAAWCAMRKHELLAGPAGEDNAYYFIKKGDEPNV